MASLDEARQLMESIKELVESGKAEDEGEEFWSDAGAKLMIFIDGLVQKPERVNAMTPKDYSKNNICIIATIFTVLKNITGVNEPFNNTVWNQRYEKGEVIGDDEEKYPPEEINTISFYELAISRCCAWICQLLGDRYSYIQKLMIKNIFGSDEVCSLFASDIYMFLLRLMPSNQQMIMCQLIMNICRMAPPDAFVRGAALINRIKHPIVNFGNSKYQYLLDFS